MKMNSLNLNFMKTSKLFMMALLSLALVTSCSNDDDNPPPVNEVELITDVVLTFTNINDAMDVVTMVNDAPDGQEGTFTNTVTGTFTAGETYQLRLTVENSSEAPDIDDVLNDDIIPEADEHFFVYAVSSSLDMTMTRDASDVDGPDGVKLGVNTTWVAGAASMGNLQIILVHEPEGADDSDEFGSVTGGEEDFTITFTMVEVQ